MRRMVLTAFAILLTTTLAGCGGPYAGDLGPSGGPPPVVPSSRWMFEAGSNTLLDLNGSADRQGMFKTTGYAGAEPNIGITDSGTIYISSYDYVVRPQTEDLRMWEIAYEFEPDAGSTDGSTETADPMLWVDPVTDRIYASHMYPAIICMAVAWSDDDGETWDMNEESCTLPGLDHQKFLSAPPGPNAPSMAGEEYPTVAYQCYQKVVGTDQTGFLLSGQTTHCNISYDGGVTWPAETISAARLPAGSCGGINGHPAGAYDGTIAVPITLGCDGLYVAFSADSGLTWRMSMGPKSVGAESIDPDLTFTEDGTLYAIWRGSDHLPYLARTTDMGLTWEGPWRVSPPHLTSTVFQVISSGQNGEVAMAFLGTNDTSGPPSTAPDDTRWHLYVVTTDDATASPPLLDVVQVTSEPDAVQVGCVWLNGGGHPCRNMLDFIDSAVAPDGTFYVAFTKGCLSCRDAEDKQAMTALAWVDGHRFGVQA